MNFGICSYIQKTTLDLIEKLKTSIYSPKHTNHMKIYFIFFFTKTSKIHIFFKTKVNKNNGWCWSVWHGFYYWGPHRLTSTRWWWFWQRSHGSLVPLVPREEGINISMDIYIYFIIYIYIYIYIYAIYKTYFYRIVILCSLTLFIRDGKTTRLNETP